MLYGKEIWVVTGEMLNILEGFHYRSFGRITGMMEKCVAKGTWEYTPAVVAIESVGLYPIQEYIWRRQVKIAKKVACLTTYELCTKVEQKPGTSRMIRWWDRDVVQEYEE